MPDSSTLEFIVVEPSRDKGGVFVVARRQIGGSYVEFARAYSRYAARKIAEALNQS